MPVVNSTPKSTVFGGGGGVGVVVGGGSGGGGTTGGPVKDSRWLTLEVCREFARNKCTRADGDCRFAHPTSNVEIQNGRVTCCFDSIKGRCQRSDPPCKYFHPPQHLKEQLLQNGRNNLIWRNIQMQGLSNAIPQFFPSVFPLMTGQTPRYLIQPSSCLTKFYNSVNPSTTTVSVESTSPNAINGSAFTSAVPDNSAQQMPCVTAAQDSSESESASNGTQQPPFLNGGNQSMYWMNSALMDSSSNMAYYSPVFYQGLNTFPGVVPVVKPQLIPDMRTGGLPVYQCSAPTYPQVALSSVPASQQQTCYQLAVPTVNRY